ncbi:tetraketide alpha-pyrone reductase 1-like isoform X2 [Ipomoea triloba]|uniref:tetraketide alpha-pyrone reductase 1-like isoform X2 n=1 Tax=Ipomoea triloba TaxID=35885 RepID=UPI00125DC59A|nr:tetraketide alpha-pyrone reductase 1-like isoform X2 [Ipomoea triloba]
MSGEGKVVCVTGASGFIASWLVKLLLRRGYTVNATVRSLSQSPLSYFLPYIITLSYMCMALLFPRSFLTKHVGVESPNKVAHLLALEGAKERLHLFEADLLEENSFDPAINGCDGVFHTASPVSLSPTKAEIVDPAVKGTLNVLGSCVRTPSVKRVVVTSSAASIMIRSNPINPTDVIDETWFADKEFAEETKQWYSLSKILAEEAAWKYAGENGIDMVSLHPCLVIGPILQPTLNFSTNVILRLIKEEKGSFSVAGSSYVDVRDVANAHIQAFEVPSASGRYCLVGETIHSSKVLKIAGQLYPSLPIPNNYFSGRGYTPVEVLFQKTTTSKDESELVNHKA